MSVDKLAAAGPSRRGVVQAALAASAAGAGHLLAPGRAAAQAPATGEPVVRPRDVVLFQGDSITDAGRERGPAEPNSFAALGKGYAWLAAATSLVDRPDDRLQFFNRGASGNKVYQLAERWQADCLDMKPDVLSVLIGVNDIWHMLNGQYDGTVEKYEQDYHALIERTREALPAVRLAVGEPFVLRCGAVNEKWFPLFDEYRAAARRVAEAARATFIPFHAHFEAASKLAPPEHWAADGVHPTPHGAALMAHAWRRAMG